MYKIPSKIILKSAKIPVQASAYLLHIYTTGVCVLKQTFYKILNTK